MPRKNKTLLARIRYVKKYASYEDAYILELWDEKKGWSVSTVAPCRKAVDFPDVKENEFIHHGLLAEISQLQTLGYTLQIELSEEETK